MRCFGGDILKRNILKIITILLFIFVGFTFLIIITKLPQDTVNYSINYNKVTLNISWKETKKIIINSYKNIFNCSLGYNLEGNSIWGSIPYYLKNSLLILVPALIISSILGILIGISTTLKIIYEDNLRKIFWRTVIRSIPEPFVIFLLYLIALKAFEFKSIVPEGLEDIKVTYYILPIILLSIFPTMKMIKLTRQNAIKIYDTEYGMEYFITAQMKGASSSRILNTHLLKNAFIKISKEPSSYLVLLLGNLMIVEHLLNFPGLTYKLIKNYNIGDMDTVFGIIIILGLIYLMFYLIFRIIGKLIDPLKNKTGSQEVREVIV